MRCGLVIVPVVLAALGCQLPPERLAIRPLPEDSAPLPYADLVARARAQATAANEAFYINDWTELEEAAHALGQSARFLVKATEVPAVHKKTLNSEADELGKEAAKLATAAKSKQVRPATDSLQRLNLLIRNLRADG